MHIGWMQDTHTHTDPTAEPAGAQREFVADYNYLVNTVGVETIYVGGDVCHADKPDEQPHVRPSAYDQFFSLVERTTDPSALERLIPGNHDVPLSTFLAADNRCVLRDRIDYPRDSLTVLFVNTQATGFVTGSSGPESREQGGVGTETCRVGKDDVEWMDAQLSDAATLGHTVLILPHAALTPIPSCPYERVQGYRGQLDAASLYNIVVNYREVHGLLADHAAAGLDIVVPVSHLYQFAGEGNETIDGIHYVYKKHYWESNGGNSGPEAFHTFGHIEMDGNGATVTTVEHANRTATTILDVSF